MKKLYRKGTVHPSPPPPLISDQLSFLPPAILTLTIALSTEDREVLAYLLSCSSNTNTNTNPRRTHKGDHPPLFNCSCFRCYMSYWVRWDSSPNHQLIHEIIEAFEDWLSHNNKSHPKKKDKRNKKNSNNKSPEFIASARNTLDVSEHVGESSNSGGGGGGDGGHDDEDGRGGDGVQEEEKGAVRRFVGFIGERIWGAWGQ